MIWDDELEELTSQAFVAFGDEAVGNAFVRALASAPALECVPASVELVMSRYHPGESKCIDASTSVQFFKAELRRMLIPH